jgi:adenylate cyclase
MSQLKPKQLSDFWHCFEGVIPSIVATASRDGTPNISYISQIFYIDDQHVALSNQFMSKTVANILENPRAQAVVVDPIAGRQNTLDLMFDHAETSGPRFEQFAARLSAIAAHRGMENIMALRSADIYRVINFNVDEFTGVPGSLEAPPSRKNLLGEAAELSMELARVDDLDQSIELVLHRMESVFGVKHSIILVADEERQTLATIASRGYERQGAGAEIAWGQGVIGMAAAKASVMRFSNVGRHFLMADSIAKAYYLSVDPSRVIALPGLDNPQSLMAVPLIANGEVCGVIYAESPDWLAFTPFDEQALSLIANQLALRIMYAEAMRERDSETAIKAAEKTTGIFSNNIQVQHYTYDDSLFINNEYVIKGVPGRILWRMLQIYEAVGRTEFTNREFRLDATLKLPEFKDNLETRLLLLSRRLTDKQFPVRITREGRGRVTLTVEGTPVLAEVAVYSAKD